MKSHSSNRTPAAPSLVAPAEGLESALGVFVRRWTWFWFAPTDPINLGFIRIFGGLLVLYVHFCYSFDLLSYVGGDLAWVDRPLTKYLRKDLPIYVIPNNWDQGLHEAAKGSYTWSIFFHVSDPGWIWTIHIAFLGVITLFVIGLWTRETSVLTWMICMCYLQRAPILLFGMDTMLSILMLYLMIGPCGATLSVDRLLEIWKARRRYGPNYSPPVEPSVTANLALRGMQVHFCIIYMASGTSKLLGSSWWSGTALWNCYANYSFAPMTVGVYYDTLVFLCRHRWLWELVMSGGVVFTLFTELSFPFLVWLPRWRWLMVGGAVLLHTGIGVFMGLTTFSLFMLSLVASFIPPEVIRLFLKQLTSRDRPPDSKADKAGPRSKPSLALTRT